MPLDTCADVLGQHGIDRRVNSVPSPGPYLAKEADAASAARGGNDLYAAATRRYGGRYLAAARAWVAAGATLIGGCCGTGPAHIAALAALR